MNEYMNMINLNCWLVNEDERDHCSQEHYLICSGENKAWKKNQVCMGVESKVINKHIFCH